MAIVVERFFVLDFDRCLGNTTALQALLEQVVVDMTSITGEQLSEAQVETERSGGSFDTVRYVQEKLRERGETVAWREISERFIREGRRRDMLEPGAGDLLDLLRAHNIPHGIVTYGGESWQTAKLQAAGLQDIPSLITASKAKARLFIQWQSEQGFAIPSELTPRRPLVARHLTLVDDKATSFDGLPAGADGIYVLPPRGEVQLASQQGSVPPTVLAVHGLTEALDVVQDTIDKT